MNIKNSFYLLNVSSKILYSFYLLKYYVYFLWKYILFNFPYETQFNEASAFNTLHRLKPQI